MTYDARLDGVSWDAVQAAVAGHRCYPTPDSYAHPETGTSWVLSAAEDGRGVDVWLNLVRGTWYGHEASHELSSLAGRLGGVLLGQEGERLDQAGLYAAWEQANRFGWRVVDEVGSQVFTTTTDRAIPWWQWQWQLDGALREWEDVAWLPKMMWLADLRTRTASTCAVWPEGQAQAIPPVDLIICTGDGVSLVVPREQALATLGPLARPAQIGSVVGHVIDMENDQAAKDVYRRTFATDRGDRGSTTGRFAISRESHAVVPAHLVLDRG